MVFLKFSPKKEWWMGTDCVFCKIIKKEIPSKVVYEDGEILGFHDVAPQAPLHVLFIPKKHIATANDVPEGEGVAEALFQAARKAAQELGVAESGYRLVMNCNKDGGQVVYHLHLHLLAGRPLHGGMG
jgi:histidine triad (HIT) family protein